MKPGDADMSYHHRSVSQSSSPHFDAAHQQQSTASRRHFKFPPQSTTSSTFTKSLSRNYNDSALLMAVDSNIASIYTGGHRGSASLQQKKHSTRTYETSPPSTERNAPESFFPSPEQEFDPIRNGALQFVPAYNKNKQRITNTALEEVASWDAILSDDEKKKEQTPPQPKATNGTASCSGNGSFASFQRRYTDAAERSSVVGQGGRISRIKSLFSSRATVRGGAEATTTAVFSASIPPPPSPVHSNSGSNSSTYVRWPGTQDPNGRTVLVSSYDDSSVGLPPSQQPKDVVPVKAKMDEMKYADQQISQWTANTSASTNVDDEVESLDDCPSPIRANSCSPLYARNMLNTSALSNNTEDGLPQSAADFHLAAAIADARAAEKAQRGQSLSSSSFRGGAHIKSETAVRRNTMDDVDLLRQAVPLTRNKASIATSSHHPYNGGGSANRRGQSFTDASSSAAKVSFVASRSLPPGPSFSSSQVWPAGNTNNTVESEFESNLSPASKTSSAYFNDRDMAAMHLEFPDFDYYNSNNNTGGGDEMLPFRGHGSAASYSVASRPYSSDQPHNAVAAAAKAVGHYSTEMSSKATLQPPTRGALEKNDSFSAPQRNFATLTSKGFGALLDKSKEVPSLMDNFDSDSMSSSKVTTVVSSVQSYSGLRGSRSFAAKPSRVNTSDQDDDVESMSDVFEGLSVSRESDVFDNLSFGELRSTPRKVPSGRPIVLYPERILEEDDVDHKISSFAKEPPSTDGSFNLISLGGGLTAIQTTQSDFLNRRTASDFDGNLSVSDVSSNGYAKIPGFNAMISAGKNRDSSLRGIQGNFGIQPRPRPPSAQSPRDYGPAKSDYNSDSDSSSSSRRSSLFSDPYRSESGLEVFGDLSEYYVQPSLMKKVLRKYRSLSDAKVATMDYSSYENEEDDRKSFALFEMRSRIMEKDIERGLERRGGSFVVDDIATTPYARAAHRIRDAVIVSKAWRDGATISDVVNSALLTRRHQRSHFIERAPDGNRSGGFAGKKHPCSWEAVRWIDDTDMTQYRCPSLGSRHMRGFEMFTIGDCQSILLKLTNDRCQELRHELNVATSKQIIAEDYLKVDGDNMDGMMSEIEITYLTAMEEVKTISKKLVTAENAFNLVRDRIQKLIARYESMLLKIETDAHSNAGASSVVGSFYSDYDNSEYREDDDRIWARRAVRAEVRAEIAVREALLAKQAARKIQDKKAREIVSLKKKLEDLQSECSAASAEKERLMATRAMPGIDQHKSSTVSSSRISRENLDGVKQRFRDRMVSKNKPALAPSGRAPLYPSAPKHVAPSPKVQAERELIRSAGEEMYQQMVFYERSLEAVDNRRI